MEVNGTFVGEDGKTVPVHQVIKYTVGKPGGAAVMLDKMNVFYIGVPNPVTISSGTGWDRTHVGISTGSISPSGGPGKFIVTVSTPGKATITVTADNKPSTYDFRVKEIPNPVFKVGPGGTRMSSQTFKGQQFCRAELENFEFDAHFTVESATVYFSGAGFSSGGGVQSANITGASLAPLASFISRCQPGSAITFDNVKVKGPDGKTRSIQGVGIVLY